MKSNSIVNKLFSRKTMCKTTTMEWMKQIPTRVFSPVIMMEDETQEGLLLITEIDDQNFEEKKYLEHKIYRNNLKEAKQYQYNQKLIENMSNCLITKYKDRSKRTIIVFDANKYQCKNHSFTKDQIIELYYYLISILDEKVNELYSIVYIDNDETFPVDLFKALYNLFPYKYHKNLQYIYFILHPSLQLSITAKCLQKAMKKIIFITDLYDIYKYIPVGLIDFPQWVIETYTKKEHKQFSLPLDKVLESYYRGEAEIPIVIELVISYFSANDEAINTVGIFRLCGTKIRVDELVDDINHCRLSRFSSKEDPHVVCSVLKTFLQNLPEPIIPEEIGQKIIELFKEKIDKLDEYGDNDEVKEPFLQIMKELSFSRRSIIYALGNLAWLITSQNQINKMNASNMGTMFGPCVYWTDYSLESIADVKYIIAMFTYIISHFIDIGAVLLE